MVFKDNKDNKAPVPTFKDGRTFPDIREIFENTPSVIKNGYKDGEKIEQHCLHDDCSECNGTGRKQDGSMCIHHISCPCPRCTSYHL
jgi:excinuclease UvrABC ATPase subunit